MLFHRQCLYTKDKHFTHFNWYFCGRILGGDCGKVCRISVFLHNQADSKIFYTFSAEYLWILYIFSAEYWGGDYTFSAECAGGCGGVSFDEGMGEMGGVSGGNGFFRCFVVVKIGCE